MWRSWLPILIGIASACSQSRRLDSGSDAAIDLGVVDLARTVPADLSPPADLQFGPDLRRPLQAIQFGTPVTYSAGSEPRTLVAGDFNRDGRLDLVAANLSSTGISLLLGTGTGAFAAPQHYPSGPGNSVSVAVYPLSESSLGVVVGHINIPGVSLLLPEGMVPFGGPSAHAVETSAHGVAVADFNRDGLPDIASVSAWSDGLSVLLATNAGSFQPSTTTPLATTSIQSTGLWAGDLDGDGRADVVVTESFDGQAIVLLGKGDGTFQPPVSYAAPGAWGITVGDVNEDGRDDLVTVNFQTSGITVLLAQAAGGFQLGTTTTANSGLERAVLADFDRDGHRDIAASSADGGTVSVFRGRGDGTFDPPLSFAAGRAPSDLLAADLDRDGKTDLIVANGITDVVSVLLNTTP